MAKPFPQSMPPPHHHNHQHASHNGNSPHNLQRVAQKTTFTGLCGRFVFRRRLGRLSIAGGTLSRSEKEGSPSHHKRRRPAGKTPHGLKRRFCRIPGGGNPAVPSLLRSLRTAGLRCRLLRKTEEQAGKNDGERTPGSRHQRYTVHQRRSAVTLKARLSSLPDSRQCIRKSGKGDFRPRFPAFGCLSNLCGITRKFGPLRWRDNRRPFRTLSFLQYAEGFQTGGTHPIQHPVRPAG